MLSVTSPARDDPRNHTKSLTANDKWKMIWLWVESNHQPFAYETKALPFELHSPMRDTETRRRGDTGTRGRGEGEMGEGGRQSLCLRISASPCLCMEARGGVEPRAFPPSSYRFGLEDRCRERGPYRKGTRRWGDTVTRGHGGTGEIASYSITSSLPVSVSPCPRVIFGGRSWYRTNLSGSSGPR